MKQFGKKLLIYILLLLIHTAVCKIDNFIKALNIFGITIQNHKGQNRRAFLGIPFAKAPVGEKRFKDPVPYGVFNKTFNATQNGNLCPQNQNYISPGYNLTVSEDCLNLNVYTKSLCTNAKLPVIVFIYGGAYKFGSASSYYYNPKYLLDEDIVLVTLNYRVGPFGFLVSGSIDATGNYGYKDQVLALKWIKNNIIHFGGDPDCITLSGHSAGSMSTVLHMVSPMSTNLFHKVIALNGSPTHHWVPENIKWTKKLAEAVGCLIDYPDQMVECLREKPWQELDDACYEWEIYNFADLKWNYEIEIDFGQERFLTDDPSVLFKNGEFERVPLITDITKQEFEDQAHKLVLNTTLFNEFKDNFNEFAPTIFGYSFEGYDHDFISDELKSFYLNDEPITNSSELALGEIFSDTLIGHGVHRLVKFASEYVDVYYFRMDYKGNQTCTFRDSNGKPMYVAHADILSYIFIIPCGPEIQDTDPDIIMVKRFTKYFTNFAKYSNPNTCINTTYVQCTNNWPPSVSGNISTLYIDQNCSIGGPPFTDRNNFLDFLFPVC